MVEENGVAFIKIKVLKSWDVIKSLTDYLLFLNFIAILEEQVMQEMLELPISAEHIEFFEITA